MRQLISPRDGAIVMMTVLVTTLATARGDDWPRFRGPDGAGVAPATAHIPLTWDSTEHIAWKTPLPGPGSSSPVTFGDRVFITYYTGYGLTKEAPGNIANLTRHLLCVRLADGRVQWTATVKLPSAQFPEYPYEGYVTTHGYASSTPVVDATGVYAYFGTMGMFAFDHQGRERWSARCGEGRMAFGSAASPILYKDMVIINADVESSAIIALNKTDGKERWRFEPDQEPSTWCTPIIVSAKGGDELICYGKHNELLALNPATGALLWRCTVPIKDYQCPSFVAHDDVVYAIGNHPGNAVAVRLGGRGDVTASHKLWEINKGSVVSSPIYHEGHLYWAREEGGRVFCADAATGKLAYEEHFEPTPERMYASPVLASGRLYYVSQQQGTYVVEAKPQFKLLARNVIDSDDSIFSGSPAVAGNRLLLRSNRFLYCIKGE